MASASTADAPRPPADRIAQRLADARARCEQRGAHWTALREDVLRRLLARGASAKAYELLADMQAVHGKVAPMTVYRALDFLVAHGLVHRIASSSTYFACPHPDASHADAMFLVCDDCGSTVECEDAQVTGSLARTLRGAGFAAHDIEIRGRCSRCSDAATAG
jgi:Fur family zinc uptake transcriptional regulator